LSERAANSECGVEWSSLQIHKSDGVFKDLTDVQVILIKKEYKGMKVRQIFFWLSLIHFNSLSFTPHLEWLTLSKFTYYCLAYCPYILKSLSVWEHMIFSFNIFILKNRQMLQDSFSFFLKVIWALLEMLSISVVFAEICTRIFN